MNITIKDTLNLPEEEVVKLVASLFRNRKPQNGSLDYGFESHGAIGIVMGISLPHPIQVYQSNKRKSAKSPINIVIEKHIPF